MKTIQCIFDEPTGRFVLAEPIPKDAVQVMYGNGTAQCYFKGEAVPEKVVFDVVNPDAALRNLCERLGVSDDDFIEAVRLAINKLEQVQGDDPSTQDVEKSWWRRVLSFVGIGK